MATKLNLASKPFSNRALPWAVTTVVIFFSLISLAFIVRATARANATGAEPSSTDSSGKEFSNL